MATKQCRYPVSIRERRRKRRRQQLKRAILRRSRDLVRPGDPVSAWRFMREYRLVFAITAMAEALGVSSSGYYAWLKRSAKHPVHRPQSASRRVRVRGSLAGQPFFEDVAEEVFRRYGARWKPRTERVNRAYLRGQILPWFRGCPVADIDRSAVEAWFASMRATPAAANRSLPILSVILRQAELYGYRPEDSNPCAGLRRYRETGRSRFLTDAEFRRLGAALADHQAATPLPVAIVRLLALTGCRQSEIRGLRWQEYREEHLYLRDSKVGPRTVWLSAAARTVLALLPRTSEWVFPVPAGDGPLPNETLYRCWRLVREEAGLEDLRLHDLRHSFATLALRQGETVLVIGRLLGHLDSTTSLRYTHVADPMVRDATEAVGAALASRR